MRKRARTSLDTAVVDIWKREVGDLSTRNFAHRLAASEDLVLRLDIFGKLDKHRGCVNTVNFNADGDILISGSDDRRVILWDWEGGNVRLSFHSGHHNNVFQAKIMPYTEDRSIVTCAADGQVRHAQILERGKVETRLLAKHHGRAHKLAIEPGSPHIVYTCGEDGLVQHIDLRTGVATELFTCQPIRERSFLSVVQLNAIAINPRNPNLFSVAGADEFARLYDIRKYKWNESTDFGQPVDFFCPTHLRGDKRVGITGLAFSDQSELLVSYADEFIYLFSKDMGLGPHPVPPSPVSSGSDGTEMGNDHQTSSFPADMDADALAGPQVFKGHRNCETVKGVNFFGPKCEYVVSGSDCGRIFIWKKKDGELIRVMEADKDVVNCIEPHPHTMVLASSGIESDIKLWTPKALERATLPTNIEKIDLRTGVATELFTCQPIRERSFLSVVQLNAIAINPRNPNLFSVAGADEFARLYDIRKYKWNESTDFGQPVDFFCPTHLRGDKRVGITGLAFSDQSELLVSYADEFIYLFSKDMGLGPHPVPPSPVSSGSDGTEMGNDHQTSSFPADMDADALAGPQVFKGHRNCETVKGVNFFGPKCEYVVSGSDCGRIFIWKKKDGELIRVMEADKDVVNCIEPHPHTMVLASSGIESDIKLWTPKALERATLPTNIEKVLIPGRIHFFPIGGYEDDSDDDDEEYFYYDGGDSEDFSDDYEEEEEEDDEDSVGDNDDDVDCESVDVEDDNSVGDSDDVVGCESVDVEDEDGEDEEFYDSIIDDCDGSFDTINEDEDDEFGDSDDDDWL
ncbi:unnamed protein product [Coffea canephora]|uniref:Anaphase-promoting complex subunit 4 WD40 domain-containing protein n=1 Tax=Coffea canephora TaxID=49390 RepID=A0A068V165_COFCA|nr:unnamed protein product [Coffea canephora]